MVDRKGIRRVTDDEGTVWEVWEAHPHLAERRRLRDRRAAERAEGRDRRMAGVDLRLLTPDAAGWLVFRSASDERRRAPIPDRWERMDHALLVAILHQARSTAPFPRQRRSVSNGQPSPPHGI